MSEGNKDSTIAQQFNFLLNHDSSIKFNLCQSKDLNSYVHNTMDDFECVGENGIVVKYLAVHWLLVWHVNGAH